MTGARLLLWALTGITAFFILARLWTIAIEHLAPRAGSPGAGAVLLALMTLALMLIVRMRVRRR